MNRIINFLLLVVISFTIAHGVVLDTHQDEHCSVKEFVSEFSQPIQHDLEEHKGDLCNTHFMLHLSFLLPSSFSLLTMENIKTIELFHASLNHYAYKENTFRPPIV